VHVSFAANRRVYNQWQSSIPSRFIDELPKDAVEQDMDSGLYGNKSGGWGGLSDSGGSRAGSGYRRPQRMIEADEWQVAPIRASEHGFKIGDRVFHEKFGYGLVEEIDGTKLAIAFDKAGRKKVLDSFVVPS
jgi:DNA helicase II / ATP-dependent DNA helicase PcrA